MPADHTSLFQHLDWAAIPAAQVAPGIERQMIWGDQLMVCRLRIAPGVVTAQHRHAHEQITLVERGTVRFTVGGEDRISSPGHILHFPAHCEHGATMLDEEVVLIDIFSPVRRDFLVDEPQVGFSASQPGM
jgi:quercetin dioxygenase-like cupin family protein